MLVCAILLRHRQIAQDGVVNLVPDRNEALTHRSS
jgi:hypothetical protein